MAGGLRIHLYVHTPFTKPWIRSCMTQQTVWQFCADVVTYIQHVQAYT